MLAGDNADIVIVGAGIIGLSMAKKLLERHPNIEITIFEKEKTLGKHASGRNSGVLHSGIYYEEGSLKSILCADGAHQMGDYCRQNNIPVYKTGKIIIATNTNEVGRLSIFSTRAKRLGVQAQLLSENELGKIEPDAYYGNALFLPDVDTVDCKAILAALVKELSFSKRFSLRLDERIVSIDPEKNRLKTTNGEYKYGYLVNSAGLYADKIARIFGLDRNFTILPFRGNYYRLDPKVGITIKHHIYPVPDPHLPFLGIHFTRSINGDVYIGPSALPALGREHYGYFSGIDYAELPVNIVRLGKLLIKNKDNIRQHAFSEIRATVKKNFSQNASKLVPRLKASHLIENNKIGIRAQLIDKKENRILSDYVVHKTNNSIHILNAISPAFTSAFSFSDYLIDKYVNL